MKHRQMILVIVAVTALATVHAQSPALGTITFPTSAAAAAQPAFLTGVKALHNFEFDEAFDAFQQVQKADPRFALGYWGEAMSFNHPLWAEQDLNAARKALGKLAPTPQERAQKAPAGKERGLIEAVDVLFGEPANDKLARDVAYSQAMKRLYDQHPDDHEIATFYALSLLGTMRPGERGYRRQAEAAAIAQRVFQANPQHPGAAHFIIHAFDDPELAALGLDAARAYAKIAPSAPHALHMPSHIFLQLGMWDEVVASNKVAFAAAVSQAERKHLPRGREDFHTLGWLEYAQLQLGRTDDAKAAVEEARKTMSHDSSDRVHGGFESMHARYVIETERWNEMPMTGDTSNVNVLYARGLAAANTGNVPIAEKAHASLKSIREKTESAPGGAYRAKPQAIMEKEVGAAIAVAKKDNATAERLLKEAVALEATLDPPSGPPEPMKPSFEMYGEFLLDQNRPKEAVPQFEQSLQRMPKRAAALHGIARASGRRSSTAQ